MGFRWAAMSDHDQEQLKDLLRKLAEAQAGKVPATEWDTDFEQLVAARFEASEIGSDEAQQSEMLDRLHERMRNRTAKSSRDRLPLLLRRKWIGFLAAGAAASLLWIAFVVMQSPLPPGQKVGAFKVVRGAPRISIIGGGSSGLVAANGDVRLGTRIETRTGDTID